MVRADQEPFVQVTQAVAVAVGIGRVGAGQVLLGIGQAVATVIGLVEGEQLAVEVEVLVEDVAVDIGRCEKLAALLSLPSAS